MTEKTAFDAAAHMRQIRTRQGMMDYLDVKWRVAWFNSDHAADGSIITEIVSHDDQHARFKATVTVARGDAVQLFTGHGSETQQDFPDFFEKAETKAVGRALALAGYGTDMATDLDDGEPLDGRGAAKDERASRRMEPNERQRVDQQHERNTAPPQARQPEPSRIPATRRPQPEPAHYDEGRSNVHQHAQLRTLTEHGFDLSGRLQHLAVGTIEELTSTQAKELIIEGRTSLRDKPQPVDDADDVLRDELRELGTRGFDLGRFLTGRNKELDDLNRGELEGILPVARDVVRKRAERLTQQP